MHFKGIFNDFKYILLYFIAFAALSQIWNLDGVKKMTFCMSDLVISLDEACLEQIDTERELCEGTIKT